MNEKLHILYGLMWLIHIISTFTCNVFILLKAGWYDNWVDLSVNFKICICMRVCVYIHTHSTHTPSTYDDVIDGSVELCVCKKPET